MGRGRGAEDWGSLGSWKGTQVEWTARSLSPCLLPALQLLLWHIALWMVPEAAPLSPASSLPQSFLLKCLEQVRKIQADGAELQERLVSEGGRQWRVREGTEVLQEGAQRRGRGRRRRRDAWERIPPDWERRDWGVMDWTRRGGALGTGTELGAGENFLGTVLGGAGCGVDGGRGARSLVGGGRRKRPQRDGGARKGGQPSPVSPPHSASFPPPVCHPQAVPPPGAGAARALSGPPPGFPEQLLQPGPAAGEFRRGEGR